MHFKTILLIHSIIDFQDDAPQNEMKFNVAWELKWKYWAFATVHQNKYE